LVPTFKTHQGVDVGAMRLVEEIQAELVRRPSLRRLTMIGHSLGGIYARYAALDDI
jgi:surfactin synthase thioesterase subunit